MWLITVTPIARGIQKERLYYFSSNQYAIGDIIEIPVRSRQIVAKVEEIKSVADAKSELKNLPFSIRKAGVIKPVNFFSADYMKAVEKTALYFCTTLGQTLHSLLPPKRLIPSMNVEQQPEDTSVPKVKKLSPIHANYVLQAPDEERIGSYKRLIREEFAKKESVIILLPTIAETIKLWKELQKGVEDFAFLLHQRMSRPALEQNWQSAIQADHPIVVICTAPFVGLPRPDFGTIVIERESSRNYKKDSRPFIDFRIFAGNYGSQIGARIVYADAMIRSETYHKLETGELNEYGRASFRPLFEARTKIFLAERNTGRKDPGLTEETLDFIKTTRERGMRLFILSPRRGLAPRTICRNCGHSMLCQNCGGSLVLHGNVRQKPEDSTHFLCHRCGAERSSSEKCQHCGSWDLVPFRVGTEEIEKEIRTAFPDLHVIRFDKDSVKGETETNRYIETFIKTPGSVLVGTEIAFSYLNEKVEAVLVLFPELLTTVPEFTGDENALRFIFRARGLAINHFAIQTSERDLPVIEQSETSNLADFYRNEISLRKNLNYPPFSTMVLITFPKNQTTHELIEKIFKDFDPVFFEGIGSNKEDRVFFRLPSNKWPDPKFRELCLSLPLSCAVEVMPERLFS